MTNTELIQLICGLKPERAATVAEELCIVSANTHLSDPLSVLRQATISQLQQSGLTKRQAERLHAAISLGRRLFTHCPPAGTAIEDPALGANALMKDLGFQAVEKAAILALDIKHRLIACQVVHIGSKTECCLHPAEIFRAALKLGAARILVAHNHPSGSLEPSSQDIEVTQHLVDSGKALGIPVLDHLIIGNGDWLSIRQSCSHLWADQP